MSYLTHWKLKRSPFQWLSIRQSYFSGGSVEEAIARCDFLFNHGKRLAVVVGPSGVGKSKLMEFVAAKRSIQISNEMVHRIDLQFADPVGVAQRLRAALCGNGLQFSGADRGTAIASGKADGGYLEELWREIHESMLALATAGQHVQLLFDNANQCGEAGIQSLGMLWGIQSRWNAILCLDDEALVDLPKWILENCELRIDLPAWDLGETADYFEFVMARCGKREDIFSAQSITRVHELADGIPRRIAQIADLSLVAGAVRKLTVIDSATVDQVFEEFAVTFGAKIPAFWEGRRLNAG